jgi:hypothetical protein
MEAAALLDLPVHAGGLRVVHVHAVHAQVVAVARLVGVLGVDQREGNEGAAVFGPRGDHRQLREVGGRSHRFQDRPAAASGHAYLQGVTCEAAELPQLVRRGRHELLRGPDGVLDELDRPPSEGQLDPPLCAEEVGDDRIPAPAYVSEEQRRPTRRDHPPVNLRDLELRIDGSVDLDETALAAQHVEERA